MPLFRLLSLVLAGLAAVAPAAQPDLSISGSVEGSDQGVEPGGDISLDYTVFNGGTGEVNPTIGFYFSTDQVLDTGDSLIGTDEAGDVGAGETEDDSEDVNIPSDVSDGEYYILFVVDYNDVIAETNESNNVDAAALTVGAGGGGGSGPDLVVSASIATDDDDDDDGDFGAFQPAAGEDVSLDYTLSNIGDVNSGSLTLRVYFSSDTVLDGADEVLLDIDNDGVDAGDNSDDTATVTIPEGTADGTYYILLEADADDEVAETNEGNNMTSIEVAVDGTSGGNAAIGEIGTFSSSEQAPGVFYPVSLTRAYASPVVVAPSFSSEQIATPAVPRVRAVTADRFEIQLAEWPYLNGAHANLDIPYLVVEEGVHTLDDGRRLEAGFATTSVTGIGRIDFGSAFPGRPVVFAQAIGGDAVVASRLRVRNDFAQVRIVQQEAGGGTISPTTVAWVAIEAGVGTGQRPAAVKRVRVDNSVTLTRYGRPVSTSAVILAATQSISEDDPVVVRIRLTSRIGAQMQLQEERSADQETTHAQELVGYAVFEPGALRSSSAALAPQASASAVSEASALTVGPRPNPVRDRAVIAFEVAEAGSVRLDVFDTTGRRVATLADGPLTAGAHEVPLDASRWSAGVYLVRLVDGAGAVTVSQLTVVR